MTELADRLDRLASAMNVGKSCEVWVATSDRELVLEAVAALRRHAKANHGVGRWLSAALEDPAVCEEMKTDINTWFEAHEPWPSPLTSVMGAAKRAATVVEGWSDSKRDYADRVTSADYCSSSGEAYCRSVAGRMRCSRCPLTSTDSGGK